MPTFNIISIDGGGLRGIVPLRILQKVEEILNEIQKEKGEGKEIKLLDRFDMISGTSTGGLLACCLTIKDDKDPTNPKYTLRDIVDLYLKRGNEIFPIRTGLVKWFYGLKSLIAPPYSPQGLNDVLKQYAGEQRTIKEALRPILVSTYDLKGNQSVFFKTSEANENPQANARIFDVCRATSAAPTYLPAYHFDYKGKPLLGIDGGVYVNNPTMAALAEISRWNSAGPRKAVL